jgi:2-oxoglutarate dehydrogenase E1 component
MSEIDPNTFLSGNNAVFIAELYARYLENPSEVDESWRRFFGELSDSHPTVEKDLKGPAWSRERSRIIGNGRATGANGHAVAATAEVAAVGLDGIRRAVIDSIRALQLIRSYRVRGHLEANLDPLGLVKVEPHPELHPATYGFTEADYDRPIIVANVPGLDRPTLREILAHMRATYCGTIGVEFMHIQDPDQKAWILERIETERNRTEFTQEGKRAILKRLTVAEIFERFLDKRYTGTKRFGLEGGEALIPALEQVLKRGGQLGMKS